MALPLEITMHAIGVVGSVAIPVFLAAPRRLASEQARFFFHEYSWTHSLTNVASQTTMTEQTMRLYDAVRWSSDVIKATTKLTDTDFARLKLFDRPVMMSPADAREHGLVSGVEKPSISAGGQSRIVV